MRKQDYSPVSEPALNLHSSPTRTTHTSWQMKHRPPSYPHVYLQQSTHAMRCMLHTFNSAEKIAILDLLTQTTFGRKNEEVLNTAQKEAGRLQNPD